MKKTIIAMALGVLICSGCTTMKTSYHTEITINRTKVPHEYTVKFRIEDVNGAEHALSPLWVTLAAEDEGYIRKHDEDTNDDIACTALITESENRLGALTTTITIKSKGKLCFSNTQNIIIEN